MDPKTGAGAYMISGGGNGSETQGAGTLEQISSVLGLSGTIIDLLRVGYGTSEGLFMEVFRFILGAASKLFSGVLMLSTQG